MRILRSIGSLAFVLGLFTIIFIGVPWYVIVSDNPVIPWWLRVAIFCLLGGILFVMLTVALEHKDRKPLDVESTESLTESQRRILLQNSAAVPGREVTKNLGLVQGHTVFAIWIGNDLSAIVRLILGGELTEYTDMMGKARVIATQRMLAQVEKMGTDAILNIRYMTTSVIGSAAECSCTAQPSRWLRKKHEDTCCRMNNKRNTSDASKDQNFLNFAQRRRDAEN